MKKFIALSIIVLLLTGCENGMRSAELMSMAADKCVLSVRDQKMSYSESPSCREIKVHAYRYLDESHAAWWKSTKAEALYESAKGRAWMAVALHNIYHKDRPMSWVW